MVPQENSSGAGSQSEGKPRPRGGRRGGPARRGRGRGPRGPRVAPTQSDSASPEQALAAPDIEQRQAPQPVENDEIPFPEAEAPSERDVHADEAAPENYPDQPEAEAGQSEPFDAELPRDEAPPHAAFDETPPERPAPQRREPRAPGFPHPPRQGHRPQPTQPAIDRAIEQVNQIIDTLRDTLDDMDEVLETLELAQRQKILDEQEIEKLQRALRGLQRPREQGRTPQRPQSQS